MLTLEKVIAMMGRMEKYCWTLWMRQQGGVKEVVGKYPVKGGEDEAKDGKADSEVSIALLEELVGDLADGDGETKFVITIKSTPKSNGDQALTYSFKTGQASVFGGLGGTGGGNHGGIGMLAQIFQTNKADNMAMMEVIAERKLLDYKSGQLELQKADFEKEKKTWFAEHKELREKWEKLRDATKEGAMDAAPDLLKGIIDALRGDKTPEVKPLAGADTGKEAEPQTEEARIIEDLASWTFENVKDIYTLRRLNTAMKSNALRELSSFLALEVPDEAVREKLRQTVVRMVKKMKEGE
jgi:hypothetical protein